ncbi:hypothetical protein BDV34DRAFT_131115 [Aspergillus parasiticus]|uniref:MARVEL domain-containing protein n=1 Tax=Aspergillus parasiticus TaxID=5067 RepID=A0A5N6DGI8_ASPPA|nr:hypothetical protein BDV34DRAFT_131115 [Aspergillus parasiticus]
MQTMDLVRLGIHALQSVIALAIIGCSAAVLSSHTSSAYGIAIFTAVATTLVAVFIITGSLIARYAYKFWIMVGANAFTTVFWIATIATLAHHHSGGCGGYKHHYCYKKRYTEGANSLWVANLALSVIDGLLSIILLGLSCCMKRSSDSF